MDTETTTPAALAEAKCRLPMRRYEVTFADGRRQRLEATRVQMPRNDFMSRGNGMVEFRGPVDSESHLGRAGRLVLAAQLGSVVVKIVDLDADIADVYTALVTVKQPSFWERTVRAIGWQR
jgi:hypothetical protein